jgi:hypothetical protein
MMIHTSEIWLAYPLGKMLLVDVDVSSYLIMFPCDSATVALLIVGIMAVKGWGGRIFGRWLMVGTAYFAVAGSIATIYTPFYGGVDFSAATSWFLRANPFAHSFLLFGGLYLFTGGFINIKLSNILCALVYNMVLMSIAAFNIFWICLWGWDYVRINPLNLIEPLGGIYPLYWPVLFAIVTAFIIVIIIIYELCCLKPEDRFYKNWRNKSYWLEQ